jgi:hypothetical protein
MGPRQAETSAGSRQLDRRRVSLRRVGQRRPSQPDPLWDPRRYRPERLMALLPSWNPMPAGCSNIFVRAGALADIGVFDTALHIPADWELLLRLARHGRPACVSRPQVGYRLISRQQVARRTRNACRAARGGAAVRSGRPNSDRATSCATATPKGATSRGALVVRATPRRWAQGTLHASGP